MTVQVSQEAANPVDALALLLATNAKARTASQRDLLLLALSAVQLAQRTKLQDDKLLQAAVSTVQSLAKLKLDQLSFPVLDTLLSNKYAAILEAHSIPEASKHKILLESLFTFLTIVEPQPASATEATLQNIVTMTAEQQPVTKPVPYPAVNYRTVLRQIFNPGKVAAVDLEPLSIIVYRGELLGGGFGPELWGLAYTKDSTAHVLLETGEYISIPANSLTLASTKDYGTHELPPYLLACAKLFIPLMLGNLYGYNMPPELQQATERLDKHFGSFTPPLQSLHFTVVPAEELASCENVIDSARWRTEDKQKGGAIKTLSIPNSRLQIIVSAQQAAIRPYVVATLAQSDTNEILLRLDTPREFTTKGIYLFPAGDKTTGLVVI